MQAPGYDPPRPANASTGPRPSTPPQGQSQPQSDMSTPAPLLRPPIPGARSHSSPRAPRLGLSIPPSPNARPVVNGATADVPSMPSLQPQQQPLHARPTPPPMLRLATPSGSQATPQENVPRRGVGGLKLDVGGGFSAASSASDRSRSNSGETGFTPGRPPLHLNTSSHDPLSALSSNSPTLNSNSSTEMQRTPSGMSELVVDLEKLKMDKGGQLEPGDLDDAGWRAASKEGLIEELGSLGEGAGGAVTRCKLKGGRTVFALKVRLSAPLLEIFLTVLDYHIKPGSLNKAANRPRTFLQRLSSTSFNLPLLWRLPTTIKHLRHQHCHGILRGRLAR